MAVHVREAMPADAETIAACAHALSLEVGYPAPALQAQHVRAEGFGASPRFRVQIAERHSLPVGYAPFYPTYDIDHAARSFYLQDLYVVPEARRRGAGRALMAAVARACAADGGCYVSPSSRAAARARHRYGCASRPGTHLKCTILPVAETDRSPSSRRARLLKRPDGAEARARA